MQVVSYSSLLEIANRIYETGLVDFCHPNFIADIEKLSDDPLFDYQYYLENTGQNGGTPNMDISINDWSITDGFNCGIKVAVIDDGVEDHEDLLGRVLSGYTPLNPSGYGAPNPSSAHGQACAGIIAASKDNNKGIAGVSPKSQIVPINIFETSLTSYDIAAAIDWAWDDGEADVLSNSWGYLDPYADYDNIRQAITRARTLGRSDKGSIVVFASGNSNSSFSGVTFPANVNGVVTVGAINNQGTIWYYSSRGPEMDLVTASGDVNLLGDVYTTDRTESYGYNSSNYMSNFGGTSAACPQVSGIAALVLSLQPNLTESQVVNYLTTNITDLGVPGHDNTYGFGLPSTSRTIAAVSNDYYPINGWDRICNSEEASYTINIPPGSTVSWSVNPPTSVEIIGPTNNTTVTIKGSSPTFTGVARLFATVSIPGCGSFRTQKNIVMNGVCH